MLEFVLAVEGWSYIERNPYQFRNLNTNQTQATSLREKLKPQPADSKDIISEPKTQTFHVCNIKNQSREEERRRVPNLDHQHESISKYVKWRRIPSMEFGFDETSNFKEPNFILSSV